MRYALLLALILLPAALAAQHTSLSVHEEYISQDTIITWDNQTQITYILPATPLTLSISDGSYQYSADDTHILVSKDERNTTHITARYQRQDFIEDAGDERIFSVQLQAAQPQDMYVLVRLPEKAALAETNTPASPEPQQIHTDGRSVIMTWSEYNTTEFSAIVRYEHTDTPWTALIIAALFVATGAYFGARTYRKAAQKKRMLKTLSHDQQEVIKLVESGVDKQNELGDTLGWSKSKMSKVLRQLEEREVIEKKPHFKTNRIFLRPYWK